MLIWAEEHKDWATVYAVNVSAFASSVEAALVDALRKQAYPVVLLVAEDAGAIVGHIMFSPVSLPDHPELKIMGLAPMTTWAFRFITCGTARGGVFTGFPDQAEYRQNIGARNQRRGFRAESRKAFGAGCVGEGC